MALAARGLFSYSPIIDCTGTHLAMNINLTIRALALLAFVAAATLVIVKPDLVGGPAQPPAPFMQAPLAWNHS